jgi:hypothetical protein
LIARTAFFTLLLSELLYHNLRSYVTQHSAIIPASIIAASAALITQEKATAPLPILFF